MKLLAKKVPSKEFQASSVLLLASLLLTSCGGGSGSPGIATQTDPAMPTNPVTPVDPSQLGSDPADYEDIDPATLPLDLTPLEPVTSRPADVSDDNRAPYFTDLTDLTMFAGEKLNLILDPQDDDGIGPGQFIDFVPPGFSYVDNLNGTRSLKWQPLQPDVGIIPITVTAVDAEAPFLRTSQTIRIQVLLPEDQSGIPNIGPVLNQINNHVIRAGDTVVMLVKAVDPNGTFGPIIAIDAPASSTFTAHPEEEDIMILRWSTTAADLGTKTLNFQAVDAVNPTLTADTSALLRIADASEFTLTGPTLRELADAKNILIGYASLFDWVNKPDGDLYGDIAASQFNIVTTENSLKWGLLNPEPGEFRWEDTDRMIAFAKANNMVVHAHPLIWYSLLPRWVQKLPLADRRSEMLSFIRTVVTRYNNDVAIWDVVNEAFEDDGSFRESVWFQGMGENYIDLAFNQARLYAPDARLIYNDYDVAWVNPKSDAMYALVQRMLSEGVALDGVGFQMHLEADFDQFESAAANLQRFVDLGLDIYITELDVAITAGQTPAQQAAVYSEVIALCLSIERCKAVQTWGFTDRYSWRKDFTPLLFDTEYQPKPSFFAVRDALQK